VDRGVADRHGRRTYVMMGNEGQVEAQGDICSLMGKDACSVSTVHGDISKD